MENIIKLLIGIGIAYFVFKLITWPFSSRIDMGAIKEEAEKEPLIEKQAREKMENLQKVLEMFDAQNRVTNDNVQKALDVSDATATNYLEELEEEGKIRQVGTTGRGVYYELRK